MAAEDGRRILVRTDDSVHSVTSVQTGLSEEQKARTRRYLISMAIRTVCFLAAVFDLRFIDGIANGLASVTIRFAGSLRKIQTGYVRNYALTVFLGVIVIIGYLILR